MSQVSELVLSFSQWLQTLLCAVCSLPTAESLISSSCIIFCVLGKFLQVGMSVICAVRENKSC